MIDPATAPPRSVVSYRIVLPDRGSIVNEVAALLGVDEGLTASMPGSAVESFAGVANGETNAGTFEVYGTPFLAAKPA